MCPFTVKLVSVHLYVYVTSLTQVIELCPDQNLLNNLRNCNKLLEQVQKGLSEYLETKRGSFPRSATH